MRTFPVNDLKLKELFEEENYSVYTNIDQLLSIPAMSTILKSLIEIKYSIPHCRPY